MVKRGKTRVDENLAEAQYVILVKTLEEAGYINYEFSNFGKPGFFSQNNTAYWFGKPYLGIGPSAHGFDGKHRSWNARNNTYYIKEINKGRLPRQTETLSNADRYNEYIMTRLRTIWGVSPAEIAREFGPLLLRYFQKESAGLLERKLLEIRDGNIHITKSGKFLGDGISAALFYVEE